MPRYMIPMVAEETVCVEYFVEADNLAEAIEKAKRCEGEDGHDIKNTWERESLTYRADTGIEPKIVD